MRLHTNTHTWLSIHEALAKAKAAGKVADHVHIEQCTEHGSRKRATAFEIKLASYTKVKGDKRGWRNTGKRGADSMNNGEGLYAATYDEWGWFIAELFAVDEEAVFGTYDGAAGFDAATKFKYVLKPDVIEGYPHAASSAVSA